MRKIIYSLCVMLTAGGLYLYAQDKAPATVESQTAAAQPADAADWLTNHAEARAQSQQQKKHLLLNFTGSDWCPPCIMMKREVYSTPEFAEFAKRNLVLNELDFPRKKQLEPTLSKQNNDLAGQYGVRGLPTIILLNPEGKMVKQYVGYQGDAKQFIAKLEEVIQTEE